MKAASSLTAQNDTSAPLPVEEALARKTSLRTTAAIQACASGAMLSAFVFLPTLADELGATKLQVGLLATCYSAAGFASFFIFGRASDLYGRRKFVHWGLGLSTLLFAFLFIAGDLASLFIFRILGGFAAGIFTAALIAYVHETKGRIARFTAYGALGWGAGTFVSGIVATTWDIRAPFLLSAFLFGGAFLISLYLPPVKGQRIQVPLFPLDVIRRNRLVFGGLLIRHTGAHGVWAFWPLYLAEKGANEFWIGCILAANTIFQFTIMYVIADRIRPTVAFPVGLALSAVTFVTFLLSPNFWYILAAQSLLGAAWALVYVGGLRFVTENNVERATASGLLHATLGLAGIIGPTLSGVALAVYGGGYDTAIYIAIIGSLLGTLFALPLLREGSADKLVSNGQGAN